MCIRDRAIAGNQAQIDQQDRICGIEQRLLHLRQRLVYQAHQATPIGAGGGCAVGGEHKIPVDLQRFGLLAQGLEHERVEAQPLAAEAAQQLGFDMVRKPRLDGQHEKTASLVGISEPIFQLLRLDRRGGCLVGARIRCRQAALHGRGDARVLRGGARRRAERLRRRHVARASRGVVAPDEQRANVGQKRVEEWALRQRLCFGVASGYPVLHVLELEETHPHQRA